DQLGRDLFTRTLFGARVSLLVGLASTTIASALGIALGVIAGYHHGPWSTFIMRLSDVQLSFPFILLAIVMIAVLGPGLDKMILVFSVTGWVIYTRTIRASMLTERTKDYVAAAKALGIPEWRILARHLLPNVLPSAIVIASF